MLNVAQCDATNVSILIVTTTWMSQNRRSQRLGHCCFAKTVHPCWPKAFLANFFQIWACLNGTNWIMWTKVGACLSLSFTKPTTPSRFRRYRWMSIGDNDELDRIQPALIYHSCHHCYPPSNDFDSMDYLQQTALSYLGAHWGGVGEGASHRPPRLNPLWTWC